MRGQRLWRTRTRAAVAIALSLSVCGATQHVASADDDKAGGDADPVVLTFADGTSGLYSNAAVQLFVDQVEELSDGELHVDVHSEWGDFAPDVEQQIVGDVAAGEADLAWVWAHAYDTLGITSFRALNAPMLIDSYPLQQAVVASDIPGELLADLDAVGVTGLAVLADGLQKPIAVDHPLLSPADYEGIMFTSRRSATFADAVLALGADTEVAIAQARAAGLANGEIQGFERSLHLYSIGDPTLAPYATANVNLWADPAVLIADPDTLAGLTDTQRGWVMQAATAAAEQSTDLVNHDADLVVELCDVGTRFANASEADLTAMREAFEPVYSSLERDAQTADFIARIEQLKAATDPGPALDIPADCTGVSPIAAPQSAGDADASGDQSVLNGVYRYEFTDDELRDLGMEDPGDIAFNHGIFTWTLADGTWEFDQIGEGVTDHHEGTYAVAGDAVTFTEDGVDFEFTWSRDADGSIQLTPTAGDPGVTAALSANVWERIDGGAVEEPDEAAPLEGTYRWTLTEEDLVDGAGSDQIAASIGRFPVVFTVVLDDGTWMMSGDNDSAADGTYTVDGDSITFDWSDGGRTEFTFAADDGLLRLQPLGSMGAGEVFVWTTKPWERID